MRLDNQLRVTLSPPLMADLKALLGPSCLAPPGSRGAEGRLESASA